MSNQVVRQLTYTLVLVGLSGIACVTCTPKNPTSVAAVQAKLAKGTPIGMSREKAMAWLKQQDMDAYYYSDPLRDSYIIQVEPELKTKYSGVILGIIRDTDRSFMVEGSIQYYVFFDREDRVAWRHVTWVGTGL